MAYVTPATSLQFYRNLSLTPDYQDTLYFASASARDSFFDTTDRLIATAPTCSYQRENNNWCRVQIPIATLYHATYMRFRNAAFENKWYYAFITAINYINNETTEVEYQIDYMMTWMGDFVLYPCYVERETVYSDTIGAHCIDEGIALGDYIEEGETNTNNYGAGACTIRLTYADPNEAGRLWGGIYSGATFTDSDSASSIADKITELVNADLQSNIIGIQMVPKTFEGTGVASEQVTFNKPYSTIAGYTPKNNKLFCYPYKFLRVDNTEGSQKDYRYEFFNGVPDDSNTDNEIRFDIYGVSSNNVEVMCVPYWYNYQHSRKNDEGLPYRIGMSHWPVGAYATDSYKAYLAQKNAYLYHDTVQNNPQLRGALVGRTAGEELNRMTGGTDDSFGSKFLGALSGALGVLGTTIRHFGSNIRSANNTLDDVEKTLVDNLIQPEAGTVAHGSPTTDLIFSRSQKKFQFLEMSITPEYAKTIDDYFSMFGYKINRVKAPSMNNRENWTYVKTIGCNVHGNIPAYDLNIIAGIFDNGIRFWKDAGNIGNYSLSNDPLG